MISIAVAPTPLRTGQVWCAAKQSSQRVLDFAYPATVLPDLENCPRHIGGYQVCNKWLKDHKGRTLTADDINHYHRIIAALSEIILLMAEIDDVIDQHGEWPGAFSTNVEELSQ